MSRKHTAALGKVVRKANKATKRKRPTAKAKAGARAKVGTAIGNSIYKRRKK